MIKTKKYHVHVYYSMDQLEIANELRQQMIKDLPLMQGFGELRDSPVGPHPTPMFEAWFGYDILDEVINWIKSSRNGLSVMFHPLTGDNYEDHATHVFWVGEALELNLDIFKS
jgi:DOPA 4,5-dioxygenase